MKNSNLNTSDLIAVSNDSRLTRDMTEVLNSKLSEVEIESFKIWLGLINYHKQLGKPEKKRVFFKKLHGLVSLSIQW
jgi:hypothetical protein